MKKFFLPLCFALAFGGTISAKELSTGSIQVNGQQLAAKLFDDPAINPVCRQKFSSAKQAMFYLGGNSFAHGCWILLDGEIHTQMTRYDTNETRAYVFSPSIFKSSSVAPSNSESTLKVSAQCKQVYQARVFNFFLESVCKFDAGVAEKIGLSSQKICGESMSEMDRKALSASVQKDIENDIYSMGITKFCQSNKTGYYQLNSNTEDVPTQKDSIAGRPAWCKNSKLPHELAICEDDALSKNELNNLDQYAEFAKNSGLSTEELRVHRLEFFKKLKSCGANKTCIQMRLEERMKWYQTSQNSSKDKQVEQRGFVSTQAEAVAQSVAYLGLPKIHTKDDFKAYFGSCGEDISTKQMGPDALRGATSTCTARDSAKCGRDVNVETCKLVRYAFDTNDSTVWAFLSFGGSRSATRATDVYQPLYGSQEPKASQSNGFVKFDFAWTTPNLRIELNNIVNISKVNGPNDAGLVWVVSK